MNNSLNLIPEPVKITRGKQEVFCHLGGAWKFQTTCPSERIFYHLRKFEQEVKVFQGAAPSFTFATHSEEKSKELSSDFEKLLESYPLGKVSPRSPFYIVLSPGGGQ